MKWSSLTRRVIRLVTACAVVALPVLLAGCAIRLTEKADAYQVNGGLDYLWADPDAIAVRPGMRLVVHALPLRQTGLNEVPPTPTAYDWSVPGPGEALTRKDVLFANFLAISGMPTATAASGPVEAQLAAEVRRIHQSLCSTSNCYMAMLPPYAKQILIPLFSTLRVRYFNGWNSDGTTSAKAVRRKACEPSTKTVGPEDTTAPTDSLVFTWPAGSANDYQVHGAADWFLRGTKLPLLSATNGSPWYPPMSRIGHPRAFTELLIPVRFSSAATSTHWPVCSTVASIESSTGQNVVAIRRSEVFLPKGKEAFPAPPVVRDGYFTIWLDARPTLQDASAAPELKKQLVVGAGDVLVMSHERKRPTDAPVPTWSR